MFDTLQMNPEAVSSVIWCRPVIDLVFELSVETFFVCPHATKHKNGFGCIPSKRPTLFAFNTSSQVTLAHVDISAFAPLILTVEIMIYSNVFKSCRKGKSWHLSIAQVVIKKAINQKKKKRKTLHPACNLEDWRICCQDKQAKQVLTRSWSVKAEIRSDWINHVTEVEEQCSVQWRI